MTKDHKSKQLPRAALAGFLQPGRPKYKRLKKACAAGCGQPLWYAPGQEVFIHKECRAEYRRQQKRNGNS